MKKLLVVFMLLLVGVLSAQSPNADDVWVIDLNNPQFDKEGWVKPWWQVVGYVWSPIFPSPILSLDLGFVDPDNAIQEMMLNFWE